MLFSRISACVVSLVVSGSVLAADWELEKNDEDLDIKVYTRTVEGSPLKEFKGVTKVKSSLDGLVALVQDNENRPEWMFNMASSRELKKVSETEAYVYTVNSVGPFISDRDAIVHSVIEQDPETKAVTIHLNGQPDYLPVNEDNVRVASIKGYWKFMPKGDGVVEVIHQVHADPAGSIPQGIINSFIVESPLKTLAGLQEQVPNYQSTQLDYIAD